MTAWITVKDKKEKEIEKKVENQWIKKKVKPEETESVWIKKKVKKELEEEKNKWIQKKQNTENEHKLLPLGIPYCICSSLILGNWRIPLYNVYI